MSADQSVCANPECPKWLDSAAEHVDGACPSGAASKEIIDRKLADAIDVPLNMTGKIPCHDFVEGGKRNCIDPQLEVKTSGRFGARKLGWHELDPSKMCASCACTWHLSCARNFALGVVR